MLYQVHRIVMGNLMAGVVLTVLLLLVGHWLKWPRRLGKIQAYSYGTLSIWLGFATWRGLGGDWVTPAGLAVIVVAAGIAVKGAYVYDSVTLRWRQAERAERADDDLAFLS